MHIDPLTLTCILYVLMETQLKPEKPLNVLSVNNLLKTSPPNQWTDFEIILQECSLGVLSTKIA